ncbi:MAG TPA: carboxymuconolactone decarboxylase family protein [Actinocrinis sp.]|nr:carboxymuconolactone decarboxylase family protein [Actinocrinis sp.]
MSGRLPAVLLRSSSLAQIRHVKPARPGTGDATVERVYQQMEREFGVLAPPVALHSPAPDALAACWVMLRETLLVTRTAPRAAKEAVAAEVSAANRCPYCVTMHTAAVRTLTTNRGNQPIHDPLPDAYRPELAAVAVVFEYINRMVNVFLGEAPMPSQAPAAALGVVTRVLGKVIKAASRRVGGPDTSLDLLPDAPLPPDLAWAAAEPGIAAALARATASIDRPTVPPPIRHIVESELDAWDGRPKGPSRLWAGAAVSGLPERDRPTGRLALLTAMASYQVDDTVIAEYRAGHPSDRELIELTSWAAMAAARRSTGSRLSTPAWRADN